MYCPGCEQCLCLTLMNRLYYLKVFWFGLSTAPQVRHLGDAVEGSLLRHCRMFLPRRPISSSLSSAPSFPPVCYVANARIDGLKTDGQTATSMAESLLCVTGPKCFRPPGYDCYGNH